MKLPGEKMGTKQRYELGTELELALSADEGVRIVCAENPFGLEEVLICWLPDYVPVGDRMTIHLMLGRQEGWRGSTFVRRCGGYFIQVGYTSAAVIAMWEVEGDKAKLRFCITADRDRIISGYRELVKKGRFACQLRDWNGLTAMPAGVLRDHLKRTLWPILAITDET